MSDSKKQIIPDNYSALTHDEIRVHSIDLKDLNIDTITEILADPLNYLQINASIDDFSSFFLSQGWQSYQGQLEHYIHGYSSKGEKGYFKSSQDIFDLESILYDHIEFYNDSFFISFYFERVEKNHIAHFCIKRLSFKNQRFHHLYSSRKKNLNVIIYDDNSSIIIDYSRYPEGFYLFCITFEYSNNYLIKKGYFFYDPRKNYEFYTEFVTCLVCKNSSSVIIDFYLSYGKKNRSFFFISDFFREIGLDLNRQVLVDKHGIPPLLYDLVFDKKELDLLSMSIL